MACWSGPPYYRIDTRIYRGRADLLGCLQKKGHYSLTLDSQRPSGRRDITGGLAGVYWAKNRESGPRARNARSDGHWRWLLRRHRRPPLAGNWPPCDDPNADASHY